MNVNLQVVELEQHIYGILDIGRGVTIVSSPDPTPKKEEEGLVTFEHFLGSCKLSILTPLVLCSEAVPISEVHDFSTHFYCIILNKLVNALKCIIRAVEMIIKWLLCSIFSINIAQAEFFCF